MKTLQTIFYVSLAVVLSTPAAILAAIGRAFGWEMLYLPFVFVMEIIMDMDPSK